jgi:hypothetical protein
MLHQRDHYEFGTKRSEQMANEAFATLATMRYFSLQSQLSFLQAWRRKRG